MAEHLSVLFDELLLGLQVRPGGRYIDATLGAGGIAAGILRASSPGGLLLGIDADPAALQHAEQVLRPFGSRVVLHCGNFRSLSEIAAANGFEEVDGIAMDLGLSSLQLADCGRGFAFSLEGPLDMRFDASSGPTAADLVNRLSERQLADLLYRYGQEQKSRRIARAIVEARPLTTTRELALVVSRAIGKHERIDPATRTFQALRIAVNSELDSLSLALPQARDLLRPGGRLAVISFHSLEDRIVKRFLQQESMGCVCPPEVLVCRCGHGATLQIVTRKAIRPRDEEVALNPRSRSARLRVAQRLASDSNRS